MSSRARLAALIVLLLGLTAAAPALAWSPKNHKLITSLAYERLTPAARAEVDRLVAIPNPPGAAQCPATTFEDDGAWLDCARDDALKPWSDIRHTERTDLCKPIKGPHCKDGLCPSMAIESALRTLADRRAKPVDRLMALRIVVHLVEDIHQPLHGASNDDGSATRLTVTDWDGQATTLHKLWDGPIGKLAAGKGAADLRAEIASESGRPQSLDPDVWSAESFGLAQRFAYGGLPQPPRCGAPEVQGQKLGQAYATMAAPIARERMALATLRLADLLNRALQ